MDEHGNPKLEWMYKTGQDLINREEYLTGRKVDKQFEELTSGENCVEHEVLPASISRRKDVLGDRDQVDIIRKQMEDPLMAIKQKEMEARRKLLENPVKLKELHRLLKKEEDLKKTSKKSKSKKSRRSRSSSSSSDGSDLDKLLMEKYKNIKDNSDDDSNFIEKKFLTLKNELDRMAKRERSPSSESDGRKGNHPRPSERNNDRRRLDSGEGRRRNESDRQRRESPYKRPRDEPQTRRRESPTRKRRESPVGRRRRESSAQRRSEDTKRHRGSQEKRDRNDTVRRRSRTPERRNRDEPVRNRRVSNERRARASPERISRKEPESKFSNYRDRADRRNRNEEKSRRTPEKRHKSRDRSISNKKSRKEDEREKSPARNRQHEVQAKVLPPNTPKHRKASPTVESPKAKRDDDSDDDRRKPKTFGLVTASGERIALERKDEIRRYTKEELKPVREVAKKQDVSRKKALSEKEMNAIRDEMMKNADWREKDREKKVRKHRESEEKERLKHEQEFDKDFLNKHLKKAQDQVGSVESRIRSNLNNIQRSSRTMDTNFAKR